MLWVLVTAATAHIECSVPDIIVYPDIIPQYHKLVEQMEIHHMHQLVHTMRAKRAIDDSPTIR